MKIELETALQKAQAYISMLAQQPDGVPMVLIEERIRVLPEGWYIPYQSLEYVETGDFGKSLVGNWPIFVSNDGQTVGPRRP